MTIFPQVSGSVRRVLLALALTCCLAKARAEQPALSYLHHQAWTTEDGLPQASVHALLQDREGYLWLATEGGAASFDGHSFHVLDHLTTPAFTSEDVSSLTQDDAGDLWFGTSDGLIRKHGDTYRRFSSKDGLPSDDVLALAHVHGAILILTSSGLVYWQGSSFQRLPSDFQASSLIQAGNAVFLFSPTGAIGRWQQNRFEIVRKSPEHGFIALGAAEGPGDALWTFGSNFVQFSAPQQRRMWHVETDLPGSRIQALCVDRKGSAWVGTNRGLFTIDPTSHAVQENEYLRGESVLALTQDREGDLWVGTEATGIHALQPRRFAIAPDSEHDAVTAVIRGPGATMYFGTRTDGVFSSPAHAQPVAPDRLTSHVVLSLAYGGAGELWVGTPDGLNEITGHTVRRWTLAEGLPDNFVRSVQVAQDGTLWAGTRFGLAHVEDGVVQTYTQADGLASDSIGPLLSVRSSDRGKGALWVGTAAGLCSTDQNRFHCIETSAGKQDAVTALEADTDGDIWVALHQHGLALVRADRLLPVALEGIPQEIVSIFSDDAGYLWLRSSRGIFRAPRAALRACAARRSACIHVSVQSFGRADGFQSEELAGQGTPVMNEDAKGELWFATRRGIAVTDQEHLRVNQDPPNVVITRAEADERELSFDTVTAITPQHQQYSFEYTGLSLNNAARTRYRYMLEGFDRGWVDAGARRVAYYTNLPPRHYTFRVMAANSDGVWGSSEAALRFVVLKSWYRRWWAYLLDVCLAALAVFGVAQVRVQVERRRLELIVQERTRVAREVHDTLAQDIVSLSLQVELAAQHAKAGHLDQVNQQLSLVRGQVRQALDSARQSIWNLRSNLPKTSLPSRLAAQLEEVRSSGKLLTRLRITGEYRSAAEAFEDQVMRIAGEAISNVERHADATELSVALAYYAETLRLQIQDNGRGFELAAARSLSGHYGLRGLEERASLLRGEIQVESTPGAGTTITLVAPLAAAKAQ